MARVFKPTLQVKGRDGKSARRKSRKWYIEYRHNDGRTRRVAGFTDKAASQAKACRT